jgi:hypothetical protein
MTEILGVPLSDAVVVVAVVGAILGGFFSTRGLVAARTVP